MKTEAEIQAEIARRNLEYRSKHDRNDNPAVFSSWSYVCGVNDGREIEREQWQAKVQGLLDNLNTITRWEFATDGRKFDGNHKLVLKEIISIAKSALTQFTSGQPAKGVMVPEKDFLKWQELRDACIEVDAYYGVSDGRSNEADRFKKALEAIKGIGKDGAR